MRGNAPEEPQEPWRVGRGKHLYETLGEMIDWSGPTQAIKIIEQVFIVRAARQFEVCAVASQHGASSDGLEMRMHQAVYDLRVEEMEAVVEARRRIEYLQEQFNKGAPRRE
jgi:acetolactate synthase regulatory subunit